VKGHTRKRGATWSFVIDVGPDENGKRKQVWRSGYPTEKAAEKAMRAELAKVDAGDWIEPSTTPLADYLTQWIDRRSDELAPLSVTQYRSVVRNHVKGTALGGMPLARIRRAHVRSHEQQLREKGLALATRKVVAAVLSRALADAAEDGLIASNPTIGGRRRSEPKASAKFTVWTSTELRALLSAAEGDRLEALWRVAVAAGLRRGELLGLTWLGFSDERGTIEVHQQLVPTRGGPTIQACKTKGSHRTIRLDPDTVASLEAHREAQQVERALAGDAYDDEDLIFCDELGGPIHPQRLTGAFHGLRATAGIRPGRLHDVRHSNATSLLTEGVPVHVVSARLGHSSPMVTLSVYAHVLPRSDERAAEVMASVLR
jgi:integrase